MTTPAERDAIRAEAFREAAEIARKMAYTLRTNMDAFDEDAATQCIVVAQAIEARAKEPQK